MFPTELPLEFGDVSGVAAHPLPERRLEALLLYHNHLVDARLAEEPRQQPVEVAPPVVVYHLSNRGDEHDEVECVEPLPFHEPKKPLVIVADEDASKFPLRPQLPLQARPVHVILRI